MRVGASPSSFGAPDEGPIRYLEALGAEVRLNPFGRRLSREEAIAFLDGLDGLIAGLEPLDRGVLCSNPGLRALARVGIGMDNVDQDAAKELGIRLSNTPDPPARAVAELTLASALAIVRNVAGHVNDVRAGRWKKRISGSLYGATVHLVGFGRIGRQLARLIAPFEPEILVTDPGLASAAGEDSVTIVPLEEGLARAEIVSLHAGGRETILGERELGLMKPGAVLLNSARGELVDEQALLAALDSGHLGAAWFDAFWSEPYVGELLRSDGFFATPHIGTYTVSCRSTMESMAARNLARDLGLEGGAP